MINFVIANLIVTSGQKAGQALLHFLLFLLEEIPPALQEFKKDLQRRFKKEVEDQDDEIILLELSGKPFADISEG